MALSPLDLDAKQQARVNRIAWKQQRRLQRDQMKAQKDLYRMQMRGTRRRSILGPVLLLTAGVVILLVRLGHVPASSFSAWYARWWPLLLVLAGVVLVAEWTLDQMSPTLTADGTAYPRRSVGGGVIFLLILLALAGASLQGIHNSGDALMRNFSIDPDSLASIFGEKHDSTQTLDEAFAKGTSLQIDNPHGDIAITGRSDDGQMHVTVTKQVYATSDGDAQSRADRLAPVLTRTGDVLSLTVPQVDGGTADLAVTVPDFAVTTVTANHGDVSVTGLKAAISVTANRGDIDVNSIAGDVNVHMNSRSGSVKAHGVTGDVAVRGHGEDMSVSDVTGRVTLEGEFYGDVHMEHVGGASSFHTARTQLAMGRLDGELDISPHSDLSASEVAGPLTLRTRSRNITLDRIAGDVNVEDSDGTVDLTAAPPMGIVSIEDRNGEVNVTLPDHANFTVDAETKGGELELDPDLSSALQSSTGDRRATVTGTVGSGGPRVTIRTTHQNVGLHRKPVEALAAR